LRGKRGKYAEERERNADGQFLAVRRTKGRGKGKGCNNGRGEKPPKGGGKKKGGKTLVSPDKQKEKGQSAVRTQQKEKGKNPKKRKTPLPHPKGERKTPDRARKERAGPAVALRRKEEKNG